MYKNGAQSDQQKLAKYIFHLSQQLQRTTTRRKEKKKEIPKISAAASIAFFFVLSSVMVKTLNTTFCCGEINKSTCEEIKRKKSMPIEHENKEEHEGTWAIRREGRGREEKSKCLINLWWALYIYTQRGLKMWGGGGGGFHANRCVCVDPCHFFDKNEMKFSKLETIDWLDCHYFSFFFLSS